MRPILCGVALVVLFSCRFDPTLPEGTVVRCSGDGDCPTEQHCVASVSRCFANAPGDRKPPNLQATVTPALIHSGASVTLHLVSDEPLLHLEVFTLPEGVLTPTPSTLDDVGLETDLAIVSSTTGPSGAVRILASAVDLSGNEVSRVELGTLVLDDAAPTVVTVSAPQRAKPGQDVVAQVALSELIQPGATVSLSRDGTTIASVTTTTATSLITATLSLPGQLSDGPVVLSLSGVKDTADNEADPAPLAQLATVTVTVDGTPPHVTRPTLARERYSQQPGFNQVEVQVAVDDTAARVNVCLGTDCRSATNGQQLTFTVDGSQPEGLASLLLTATDEVGNVGPTVSTSLVLDYTRPTLVGSVAPTVARPGQALLVQASLSEAVTAGATLRLTGLMPAVVSAPSTAAASLLSDTLTVPGGTPDGDLELHLGDVVDLAGNPIASDLLGALHVDGIAPVLTQPTLSSSRFSRQPGFDSVRVPVQCDDATVMVTVCVLSTCQQVSSGSDAVFPVTSTTAEGPVLITLNAVDAAGNAATPRFVPVTFDFTPPTVVSVVAPTLARPGQTLLVQAALSEPLAPGAQLALEGLMPAVLGTPSGGNTSVLVDNLLVPSTTGDADLTFALRDAVDLAGNPLSVMASQLGALRVDGTAPTITRPTMSATRFSLNAPFDHVTVPVTVDDPQVRVTVCILANCQSVSSGSSATFTVTSAIPEGPLNLTLNAVDAAGNSATPVFVPVVFDYSAPNVLSQQVRYVAPPGCPLATVSALGLAGSAAVDLVLDEAISGTATLRSGSLNFTLSSGTFVNSYTGLVTNDGGVPTTDAGVELTVTDLVGNSATRAAGTLKVDTVPPRAATITNFVYRRAPWGDDAAPGTPSFSVAAPASAFEANTHVDFWSAPTGGLRVALADAATDGSLSLALQPVNRPELYVRQYDDACNVDTARAVPVPFVDVVVGLGGKVAGTSSPNPNRLVDVPSALSTATSELVTGEYGAEASTADGVTARQRGPGFRWKVRSEPAYYLNANVPLYSIACVVLDPRDNETWEFSALYTGNTGYSLLSRSKGASLLNEVDPVEIPSECWWDPNRLRPAGVVNGAIKTWDGRQWVTLSPLPMPTAQVHFFTGMNQAMNVGFDGTRVRTWLWNGPTNTWADLTPAADVDNVPARTNFRLNETIDGWLVLGGATLGGTDLADAWEWIPGDGFWHQFSTGGPRVNDQEYHYPIIQNPGDALLYVMGGTGKTLDLNGTFAWANVNTFNSVWVAAYNSPTNTIFFDESGGRHAFTGGSEVPTGLPFVDTYAYWLDNSPGATSGTPSAIGFDPTANRTVWLAVQADAGVRTYTWDGNRFSDPPLSGTPGTPADAGAPLSAAMTISTATPARPVAMLARGNPNLPTMTHFQWNGSAWASLAVTGAPNVANASLAFDSARRVSVLFGGMRSTSYLNATYELNGLAWSLKSTSNPPPPRRFAGLAYDDARGVTVLFGGEGGGGTLLNDTWEWNGTTWTQKTLTVSPPARARPNLAWDPVHKVMVLHGGSTTSDTWIYDGTTWKDVSALVGTPRTTGLLGWDPVNQSLLLHTQRGPHLLTVQGVPAQRLLTAPIELPLPTDATSTVLSGTLKALATPSSGSLQFSWWNGVSWTSAATSTGAAVNVALGATPAKALVTDGLQVSFNPTVAPPATATVSTDLLQYTVRYRMQ